MHVGIYFQWLVEVELFIPSAVDIPEPIISGHLFFYGIYFSIIAPHAALVTNLSDSILEEGSC